MGVRAKFALFQVFAFLLPLLLCTEACIFLLNGGSKPEELTISERVEKAHLVIIGQVFNVSDADPRTSRFSASILVAEVIKGLALLEVNLTSQNLITVTDFGPETKCLSFVKPGDWHVFLLAKSSESHSTVFQAQYNDIFGATVQLSHSNLGIVYQTLGWKSWTGWNECSASCGSGVQVRRRDCLGRLCNYGDHIQTRVCNDWQCYSSSLLTFASVKGNLMANFTRSSEEETLKFSLPSTTPSASFLLSQELEGSSSVNITVSVAEDSVRGILTSTQTSLGSPQTKFLQFKFPSNESRVDFSVVFTSSQLQFLVDCSNSTLLSVNANFLVGSTVFMQFVSPHPLGLTEALSVPGSQFCRFSLMKDYPILFWSPWSSCSSSCGSGTQTRGSHCRSYGSSCLAHSAASSESRHCRDLPLCDPDRLQMADDCGCLHGGTCIEGVCYCQRLFTGPKCELYSAAVKPGDNSQPRPAASLKFKKTVVCKRLCRNGGVCIGRNRCKCPMGYRGRVCQKPICSPTCKNGGTCAAPGLCQCQAGFMGKACDKAECFPPCVNGGTCVNGGRCKCPAGFFGRFCHRVNCRNLCYNGGTCIRSSGVCECPSGFFGPRCQSRTCRRSIQYKTVYKPVIKVLKEKVDSQCGRWKTACQRERVRKVVLFKIVLKPFFACLSEADAQVHLKQIILP